jgi:hypothetical protein
MSERDGEKIAGGIGGTDADKSAIERIAARRADLRSHKRPPVSGSHQIDLDDVDAAGEKLGWSFAKFIEARLALIPGTDEFQHGPPTGDNPGYEYVKTTSDAAGSTTIVIYQLRGGKRDASLPVAFADGSVSEAKSP